MSVQISGNVSVTGNTSIAPLVPQVAMSGYIITMYSSRVPGNQPAHDISAIDEPTWYDNFGTTGDIGIFTYDDTGQQVTTLGTIDWFDASRTQHLAASQGNWSGDYCDVRVNYLDENDNIVFWTKPRNYTSFSCRLRYGTATSTYDAGVTGPNPNIRGDLVFDAGANTVTYTNTKSSDYNNDWSLSGVDVSSIVKMQITECLVVSTHSSSGSAYYTIKLSPVE